MENYLFFLHHAYSARLHSFVLMPNHIHLLATFPSANLSTAMQYFMRETSRRICESSGRINHTYGGRFHRSQIRSQHYFLHAYKYVYLNPVKAGLATAAEGYRFSTLPGLLGFKKLAIPLEEDVTLFTDVEGTMRWINRTPTKEDDDSVRKALRRKVFALPVDPRTKMESVLEQQLM